MLHTKCKICPPCDSGVNDKKIKSSCTGKIVLHLLIGIQLGKNDNILGSIPNQLGSIWFHPKAMPSQTPTNHPYGFFWNINNSVPKRNWNFGIVKINFVYLCINRSNSFSESTVWDFFKKVKVGWVWLEIFWPVRFCHRKGTQVADCWLERSELRKSWNLQKARPVYESRHSTDFRTVYHLRNHY